MIGETLNHYRIVERIGGGGMGEVYRARDSKLGRDVALKLLLPGATDPDSRPRLLGEAQAAAALNHPHISTIYEVGEAAGQAYIAMEYIEGRPLSAVIASGGLPAGTAARYGMQVADALEHAHARNLIHRDLKSSNILITPEGRAKVLDFGLAQRLERNELAEATRSQASLKEAGAVAGTLPYMAPEVLQGEPAGARSDIWALGVVLYEMLSGRLPFVGRTGFELSSAILREPPAPLPEYVPAAMRTVVQRCLAKEPGQRYQRASEVRAALEAADTSTTVPIRQQTPPQAWRTIRPVLLALAGLVVVAGTLYFGREWKSRRPAKSAPGPARLSTGGIASKNQEANDYYERSRFVAMARLDLPQVRELLERALAADPHFAEARAEYGFTHALMVLGGQSNDANMFYKAEEEIRRALQDDPDSPRAHSALATVYAYTGQMQLVPAEVEKALRGNPNDAAAHSALAGYYLFTGEYDRAATTAKKTLERDPSFFPARGVYATALLSEGDAPGGIREFEKIAEQTPGNLMSLHGLTWAYMVAGDRAKARQTLERVAPANRANYLVRLARALVLAGEGKRAEALREMDNDARKYADAVFRVTLNAAEVYAVLGEKQKALEWLERAVRNGDERADWFRTDPLLANIRNERSFQQILDSIAFRRKQKAPSPQTPSTRGPG